MARKGELIVGLDIGTTKICAIVGEVTDEGTIDVIGIGSHPSKGLRKGVVVNIEATVASIKRAIEEAELMAGCEINTVYTGIAGGHIKGFNSQGIVAIKEKEVREADIQRVIDAAKAIAIPLDREVIHVLPQEYVIDEQGGIKDPLGMSGVRLEAKVHIVTGAVSSAQNIIKCAQNTGLNVADIVLQPLASSEAVLGEDEKELGVCLVDIGGGTTDIAIFSGGAIVHTGVIALGATTSPATSPSACARPPTRRSGSSRSSAAASRRWSTRRRRSRSPRWAAGSPGCCPAPSSPRSSSRGWRRSSSSCSARCSAAATRICSPPAW